MRVLTDLASRQASASAERRPLWFAFIVVLRAVFGRFGAGFYIALPVVSIVSMVATYELGRRFAGRIGASELLGRARLSRARATLVRYGQRAPRDELRPL